MRLSFAFSSARVAALACAGAALISGTARAHDTAPAVSSPALVVPVGTKQAWRASSGPRLLWTGFRATADGGEVLIQTSAAVELDARPGVGGEDGSVFVLKHCGAGRRIDRLPLDTRFFRSPVTGVSVKASRAGNLEISVALRERVVTAPRKERGPGGSWFWVIRFAPATAAATTTTTAAATPTTTAAATP